ncbi:unnamed protein product [marine sediment metagenome]|uniref:Uncharacterized protein n=1 Tax=marine sediment metagenome TaxID=412755 RepID=X1DCV0_9ZZZZ
MNAHGFTGTYREVNGVLYIKVPVDDANHIRKKLHGNVLGEPVKVEVEL